MTIGTMNIGIHIGGTIMMMIDVCESYQQQLIWSVNGNYDKMQKLKNVIKM